MGRLMILLMLGVIAFVVWDMSFNRGRNMAGLTAASSRLDFGKAPN